MRESSARSAAQALGAWLERAPWDLLVTATYRRPVSEPTALDRWRTYANCRIGGRQGKPVSWVSCTETTAPGRGHVHALMRLENSRPSLLAGWIETDWRKRHGLIRVEAYDPVRPGARYVAKQFGHPARCWDASPAAMRLLERYRPPDGR